jgi:hypothetical protein
LSFGREFSIGHQERQAVSADLKAIYQAATEIEALQALEQFQVKWDRKYPVISRSWRANWARVKRKQKVPFLLSLNFSLRKILKGRSAFPHDDSVYRLVYLGPSAGEPEVDDADQELERGAATVCDPLRRSLTVRGIGRNWSLIVMIPFTQKF